MDNQLVEQQGVRVAVEGCGHGTLNAIYSSVEKSSAEKGWDGVDLLIIGGDFQSVRNAKDLNCMSVPVKYREIGDFHEYYSGTRNAPYLTIFVGGNHEASNYLWELYYGGWVAPNIFYLGAANVIRLGPLRIAAMSGIWKGFDYRKPHFERLPYNQDDIKSIYHVREIDVRKLLQIRTQVDIGISHDWPRAVEWSGNHQRLFRQKDMFEAESRAGTLGSQAAKDALSRLRPAYWFAAHLHVKFSAVVDHDEEGGPATAPRIAKPMPDKVNISDGHQVAASASLNNGAGDQKRTRNTEEIELDMDDIDGAAVEAVPPITAPPASNEEEIKLDLDDMDDDSVQPSNNTTDPTLSSAQPSSSVPAALRDQLPASFAPTPSRPLLIPPPRPAAIINKTTHFLALDKCLPKRQFLQLLEIEPVSKSTTTTTANTNRPFRLEYDPEWLAITRALASELHLGDRHAPGPSSKSTESYLPLIEEAEKWVYINVVSQDKLLIPENFATTAPVYDEEQGPRDPEMPVEYNNPQTMAFCELLGIDNKFFATDDERAHRQREGPVPDRPRFNGGGRGGRGGGRGGRGGGRGRGRGRGRGWH